MRVRWITLAAALATAAPLAAASRRPLTPEDVASQPVVSDPRISPAGDRVAFVVTRLAPPRVRTSEVWVVGADGTGLARVPVEQARAPRWSPDGRTLAVIGGAERPAVHALTPPSGAPLAITGTEGARDIAFSPDGRSLAFLRADDAPPRTDPVVVDEQTPRPTRLWVVDAAGGVPRRVLPGELTAWRFAWSPDSRRIAVLASSSPLAEGQEYGSRLLSMAVAGGEPLVLAEKTSPQSAPAFSPDGRTVAYLAPLGAFKERGVPHVVAADASSPPRPLAAAYPGTFWELGWDGESRLIGALGQGAEHGLAAIGADGTVTRLAPVRHSIIPLWEPVWSADAAARRVAYLSETSTGREVWTANLDGSAARRITHMTAALDEVELGKVEAVRWTNAGADVEGILVSPASARGAMPLLVWLHGGPAYHWGLGAQVASWAQLMAARGYRVLLPNFRGSTGYGQSWLTANVRDWGEGPMSDVMSGVDALIARGLGDPQRLYLGGGSYGGYLSYWMLGHTTRFRAAYLRAGISDPLSAFPLTDEPSFFTGYMGGTAFDDPDVYRRLAPLAAVAAVKTPLLIVHGEQDARVPLFQSHLFHEALRQRGVPTRLVVYPREGHSILEYDHQIDHMNRMIEWYAKW
jgi:dipeptidyl aminopeptidase/acylaminoacyl peptidase